MKAYLVLGVNSICFEEESIPKSMKSIEVNLKPIKFNERFRKRILEESLGIAILNNNGGNFIGKDEIKTPIIGNNLHLVYPKCPDTIGADYC